MASSNQKQISNGISEKSKMTLRMNLQILLDIYFKTVQKKRKDDPDDDPRPQWGELFHTPKPIGGKRTTRIRYVGDNSKLSNTEIDAICQETDIPHEYFQEINNKPVKLITEGTSFSNEGTRSLERYLLDKQDEIKYPKGTKDKKNAEKTPRDKYYQALNSLLEEVKAGKYKDSPVFLAYYYYLYGYSFSSRITNRIDDSVQFLINITSSDWKKCNDTDLEAYCDSFDELSQKLRAYLLCKEEKFF